MKQIEKVNVRQMTILIIIFFVGTTILITPTSLAAEAKQDAWIAALIGSLFSLLIGWFYAQIATLFPEQNLAEILETTLGTWIGKAISLLYMFFFIVVTADLLWYVGNFLTTQIMTATPPLVIHIAFMFIVIFGVRLGIEVLARSAEIFLPVFIGLFLFFVFVLLPEIDVEKITPFFEQGIKPVLHSSLFFLSVSSFTMFTFFYILPSLNRSKKTTKVMLTGIMIGGIIMVIVTALSILVLGPDYTAINNYPTYVLARKVSIGQLERIEVLIAGMWMISIFFKTALYFHASLIGMKQIFRLQDYRLLILPISMVVVVISLVIYPDSIYASYFNATVWIPYILTIGVLLPMAVWLIGKLKNRVNE